MVLLDGMMGAIVSPSIWERVFIFSPMHAVALLASSQPTRSLILKLIDGDRGQPHGFEQAAALAPSLGVLLGSVLMQTGVCVCVCVCIIYI
jgi:hypothetical protein